MKTVRLGGHSRGSGRDLCQARSQAMLAQLSPDCQEPWL